MTVAKNWWRREVRAEGWGDGGQRLNKVARTVLNVERRSTEELAIQHCDVRPRDCLLENG